MSPAKNLPAADLREEYGAPFSIVSREEGSRYKALLSRDFNSPRCLDFGLIERLGWTSAIDSYCRILGLEKLVKMKHDGYHQLMLEFYTTLSFDEEDEDTDRFHCRLMGESVTVTRKTLCDIFGFREGGHKTVPQDFDRVGFWKEISGKCGDFKMGNLSINCAQNAILLHMYKFISQGVFGKSDLSIVVVKDLFYLSCVYSGDRVCTPSFLIGAFKSVLQNKRVNMCLGNFITAIAVHFGTFDPSDTDMTVLPMLPLVMLKKYQYSKEAIEEKSSSSGQANGEDTNPVAIDDQPAVDTLMLISHKLEKLQKQVDSGFNAIETRFEGLEKKVNVMRACSKISERKWIDSRQQESNGTNNVEELKQKNFEAEKLIEKLRIEKSESDKANAIYKTRLAKLLPSIKKIAEGLSMMSSMKVVDLDNLINDVCELGTVEEGDDVGYPDSRGKTDTLGNRSIPDINTEDVAALLPGVQWTSNSNRSRSKRFPKNGVGSSLQPWAIEDGNAHNVKNSPSSQSDHNPPLPGSNECLEPLGSVAHSSGTRLISGEKLFCKTTSSSLAASGDIIIEVNDSDDVTKPNRAAQTSKRVLSSDVGENEMNFVHISKRNRTDQMGKKDDRTVEKNALIHEKGNEVLKSSHDNVDCYASGKCVEEAVESENSLNDESFTDSEGEALSDSGMEDLIAHIRRG